MGIWSFQSVGSEQKDNLQTEFFKMDNAIVLSGVAAGVLLSSNLF